MAIYVSILRMSVSLDQQWGGLWPTTRNCGETVGYPQVLCIDYSMKQGKYSMDMNLIMFKSLLAKLLKHFKN